MDFTSNRVERITGYVEELNATEQKRLLDLLEKKSLLAQAAKLSKTVKKNDISIEEICDIVNDVRKKNKRK